MDTKELDMTEVEVKAKEAVCPVHGRVGGLNWVIQDNDKNFQLCLRCMAEKLVEIGVREVEFKEVSL